MTNQELETETFDRIRRLRNIRRAAQRIMRNSECDLDAQLDARIADTRASREMRSLYSEMDLGMMVRCTEYLGRPENR